MPFPHKRQRSHRNIADVVAEPAVLAEPAVEHLRECLVGPDSTGDFSCTESNLRFLITETFVKDW